LSGLARMQVARSGRQVLTARQVSEQAQALDALARVIEQTQAGLRESVGELWAETSQPGAAPDSAQVLRSARQAAVVAARMGTGAAQAHDLCRQIVALMRQTAVEGSAVTDGGRELDLRATQLQTAVEEAEAEHAEDAPVWLRRLRRLPWWRRPHAG